MSKKFKIFLYSIAILLSFVFISAQRAQASDVNGLAMEPIYPNNQITKNGILYPMVSPGSTQTLSFNIINLSNQSQKLTISPNTAITSNGPSIDYSQSKYKYDSSLKYKFSDIFFPKKIKLDVKPNTPTKVTFTAKIPKKEFKGLLMGGFYIDTNQTSYNNDSGTSINNKYTYAMPVIMRENKEKSLPELKLGTVTNGMSFKAPIISSKIYNKQPAMIDQLKMDTTIKDDNNKLIFHSYNNDNSVAPNSSFNYVNTIPNKDNLQPGTYHIKIIAKSPEGKWILQKSFTVSVGQYLGTIFQNNQWLWLFIIIIILLIVSFIGYLIYKKHKKNLLSQSNDKSTISRESSGSHFK
ncbi:DUF916 and DUF3324 domain-containing protein [Apilactobacillus apisilvae]|uniref:DUF916 and DUF3324 domain-containing protein n=1 Tax=Apilactobacillus apisilvae TaxID=2923364 RepID=A0ABY4PGH6_9LACO|nr:DUF916 and DUF3324 domain-containing protein [Apilactobacillus apisilvae]UQS84677.1 DUF916 and DUF3324 domain-containing protein [Apilactobacillus apisilvae]